MILISLNTTHRLPKGTFVLAAYEISKVNEFVPLLHPAQATAHDALRCTGCGLTWSCLFSSQVLIRSNYALLADVVSALALIRH